ncbi:MAG: sigma factor-like helix-turn-helix DNA-binding protein [Peptostreptococcaceae bacterium]|nr:sigma factor-like helix-turn-helix DNA-binding protein [Peptostreptococcaceae bacterium]
MTIREELNEMRELDRRVAALGVMIADLINSLPAMDYSDIRVQASKTCGDLSGVVAKIDEYRSELDAEVDKWIEKKRKLGKEISSILSGKELQVILLRYFCSGYTWERIAKEMNYSLRQVKRFHNQALSRLGRKDGTLWHAQI